MKDSLIFQTVPIGSLLDIPEPKRESYINGAVHLPRSVRSMLFSPQTGAYIRGLANSFDIPLESAPLIAFAVLRVALGEITLDQLAASLAPELRVDTQKAQAVAQDIAQELFAPMAKAQPPTTSGDIPNLLDLKNLPKGP